MECGRSCFTQHAPRGYPPPCPSTRRANTDFPTFRDARVAWAGAQLDLATLLQGRTHTTHLLLLLFNDGLFILPSSQQHISEFLTDNVAISSVRTVTQMSSPSCHLLRPSSSLVQKSVALSEHLGP